ncbi:MAG: hypothetical protein ABIG30_02880 [Candidatus Aenigmatarchaeota archaeon]
MCANNEIKLAIKNIGSETILPGEIAIYFNATFNDTNKADILPGRVSEFRGAADCATVSRVKITDPAGQAIERNV